MSDPSLPAMGIIFNKVCVLVTAAFALTLVPGFKQPEVRDRDEQTRAAASAELLALQARMNPHFLFNALNTLAALSRIAPREVPRAVGRLRHFLRASFDQHERALVPLEEELAIVRSGEGTTVTMRIPFRKPFGVGLELAGAITSDLSELASN